MIPIVESAATRQSWIVYPHQVKEEWVVCAQTVDGVIGSLPLVAKDSQVMMAYILNELIENAVKYSASDALPVRIQLTHRAQGFRTNITNWCTKYQGKRTLNWIRGIHATPIGEHYIKQLWRSAVSPTPQSKLGLLGICHDYPVQLNARLGRIPVHTDLCQITVSVGGNWVVAT
ncbi:hypothetical protein EBZ35_04275 [bacterium]|nr:hypothetical protein [bacterium]